MPKVLSENYFIVFIICDLISNPLFVPVSFETVQLFTIEIMNDIKQTNLIKELDIHKTHQD